MDQGLYYLPRGDGKAQNAYSEDINTRLNEQRIAAFRIFVSKLAYEATREDLESYFRQFGNVTDTHIPKQPSNPSLNKGYGFVSFDSESDVIRVLQTPTHVIMGREVLVDRATGRKYHATSQSDNTETQALYGLKGSVATTSTFTDSFQNNRRQYDENPQLIDKVFKREREDNSRYYNFGSERSGYASPETYAPNYSGFDPNKPVSYVFTGSVRSDNQGEDDRVRTYNTGAAPPSRTRIRTAPKLFIGRMGPETTVSMMRAYFSQFGEVVDAYIPRDSYTHRSKGFGFLTFAHKDALHAVLHPNAKHYIGGREVVVDYADVEAYRG